MQRLEVSDAVRQL